MAALFVGGQGASTARNHQTTTRGFKAVFRSQEDGGLLTAQSVDGTRCDLSDA